MRHPIVLAVTLLAVLSTACGRQDGRPPNAAEPPTELGHEAAWTVAHTDHTDTIALQRAIIDARARHDRFVLAGDKEAARQFEQAFIDSLRRIDPSLAREIFPDEP